MSDDATGVDARHLVVRVRDVAGAAGVEQYAEACGPGTYDGAGAGTVRDDRSTRARTAR